MSKMTMESPKLNHPTPPGSLSRRRKNSDNNLAKAGQVIKRLSNPLAPEFPEEPSRTCISPELPMVHYRNVTMTGSGSLGRKQMAEDVDQEQQPLLQSTPPINMLTQSQILNSSERQSRRESRGSRTPGSSKGTTPNSLSPSSPGRELEAGVFPTIGSSSRSPSSNSRDSTSRTSPGTSSGALPPSSRSGDILSQEEDYLSGRKKSSSSLGSISHSSLGATPKSPSSMSSVSAGSPITGNFCYKTGTREVIDIKK